MLTTLQFLFPTARVTRLNQTLAPGSIAPIEVMTEDTTLWVWERRTGWFVTLEDPTQSSDLLVVAEPNRIEVVQAIASALTEAAALSV